MSIYESWRAQWERWRNSARSNPAMVSGYQSNGHERLIHEVVRLTRLDDLFESIGQITLNVSPHQYVFRCDTGPLSAEIEERFRPKAENFVIGQDWVEITEQIHAEYRSNPDRNLIRPTSWWTAFGGPYGPRLYSSAMSFPLTKRLIVAYKSSEGSGVRDTAMAGRIVARLC